VVVLLADLLVDLLVLVLQVEVEQVEHLVAFLQELQVAQAYLEFPLLLS
jgi:hypothetical protein